MTIAGVLLTLAAPAQPGYLPTQLADRASQWWQSPGEAASAVDVAWRILPARTAAPARVKPARALRWDALDEVDAALFANPFAQEDVIDPDGHEARMAAEDNLELV